MGMLVALHKEIKQMPSHETPALHYWRNLNSTLDAIGARPTTFDDAMRCRDGGLNIDEAAQWIAEKQRDEASEREWKRIADGLHDGSLDWGPYANAPSKGESWGRR